MRAGALIGAALLVALLAACSMKQVCSDREQADRSDGGSP